MHDAAAVGATVRRLSIQAQSTCVDLVLSASTPIGLLIPAIVDIVGRGEGFRVGPRAVHHQLSSPDGSALDTSKTLAQSGIRDGASLLLTSSSTELMAPRFDDDAEAVSASVAAIERRWTRRSARLTGSLVTMWLAGITAVLLSRNVFRTSDANRAGCAGVAATIALSSLLAAAIAYRVYGERSIGLTLGVLATSFAALAGILAVPGGLGAPNTLLAAAASATCAAAMRVIAGNAVAFTALVAIAVIGATASIVVAITAIPLQAVGAACAATSLALVEASAPLSIMLARLSGPYRLNVKAIRASDWLTGFVAAFSVSAAVGAIGATWGPLLTGESRLPGLLFATVTAGVLLLRARVHRDLARSASLITCGIATLSAVLVAVAAAYPEFTAHIAAVSMMLGAVALGLALIGHSITISPIGRRSIEVLEYLAFAVVVPLAVWLCGLYGVARSLNLS